jgi:hypothetical protein
MKEQALAPDLLLANKNANDVIAGCLENNRRHSEGERFLIVKTCQSDVQKCAAV